PPSLVIHIEEALLKRYIKGYENDITFRAKYQSRESDPRSWHPTKRFFRDERGLLYFRDADFVPRLCVPKELQEDLLKQIHESAHSSAH
ncbi:hypothetical protein PUNSTDRAFT_28334, partial [Punctularia strigosozonata HHB-11173 SS5]|uniref:uncharacterized protein n=1 Tax=Punctularia strigosozonata (strain HHB-11173) TaxID=741275 RepID=UPI00044182A3